MGNPRLSGSFSSRFRRLRILARRSKRPVGRAKPGHPTPTGHLQRSWNATLPGRPIAPRRNRSLVGITIAPTPCHLNPLRKCRAHEAPGWQLPAWLPPLTSCRCSPCPVWSLWGILSVRGPVSPAGFFCSCPTPPGPMPPLLPLPLRAATHRQNQLDRRPRRWESCGARIGAVSAFINNYGPAVGELQRLVRNRRELNGLVQAWLMPLAPARFSTPRADPIACSAQLISHT